jgi:hypothetical protein
MMSVPLRLCYSWWIVVSLDCLPWKTAMGMLLMRWSLVVSTGECPDDDEKDAQQQQNPGAPGLFLPWSAKISKDDH